MENVFRQTNVGAKHVSERFADVAAPIHHDQHVYYAYEPPSPEHASSKHHYGGGGGGHKNNAAMSALTLLAFLFFLHILQQCVKEHMNSMTNPQIMIMTAGREGEDLLSKTEHSKIDKAGNTKNNENTELELENKMAASASTENQLMKITTTQHVPKNGIFELQSNDAKTRYPGFVNAMTDDY